MLRRARLRLQVQGAVRRLGVAWGKVAGFPFSFTRDAASQACFPFASISSQSCAALLASAVNVAPCASDPVTG